MSLLLDAVVCALLFSAAAAAVVTRAQRAAVLAFMGYGLLLGLAWVRLDAMDVALTELAVGSGLSGLVMLRAARAPRTLQADPTPRVARLAAACLALAVAGALGVAVVALPEPAPSLATEVAAHMPATGLGNAVTGVLIVFRAMDTLLETVVLLLALIGVWSLSRDPLWRGTPAPLWPGPAPAPVTFLGRTLAPLGLLVGIYLFWTSADEPGGAFQGGAVLAAMALLLAMARLSPLPAAGSRRLRLLVLAGPFAFLAVGFSGWATAGVFLGYPPGFEKAVIIAVEIAVTASIGATLALIVLGPPLREGRP